MFVRRLFFIAMMIKRYRMFYILRRENKETVLFIDLQVVPINCDYMRL